MTNIDLILITQSDTVNYSEYSKLPLERIELYRHLIYPRMVYYKKGFRSHLDLINFFYGGKFFNETNYSQRRDLLNVWNLPAMNGVHIANYLLQQGIKVKIINNFDAEWDIFCRTYDACKKPPLVGISTTFCLSYAEIRRMLKKLRDYNQGMKVVLGGAFVSQQAHNGELSDFEKPMRKNQVDYIIHSFNSEIDLKELILCRKRRESLDRLYNLAYIDIHHGDFNNGAFNVTSSRWNDPILGDTPTLCDQLDLPFVNRTIQTRMSSGCPFSCAFCSYPKTAKGFYTMSYDQIEKHIQSILRIPGVDRIIFIDDTFNFPVSNFKEMCRLFSKYNFEWFSFLRVQFIDDETAKLMKDSGCQGVYLGIESADDGVLKKMNKKATADQFLKGIQSLKKYDITTISAFIVGYPGETRESINNNIEFIDSSGTDFYTLKEFYYMKHTPVYEQRARFGLSGMGSNWSHDTMDYKVAQEYKMEMFKRVKSSIFVDPDTNLWHVAYLYDQGYTINDISEIQKIINQAMLCQIDGIYDDNHSAFNQLSNYFSKEKVALC